MGGSGAALLRALYFFVPAYVANMAPVLVQGHFAALARPMDAGWTLGGVRVLGDHKTWRGLLAGIIAGAIVYAAQAALHEHGVLRDLALVDYRVVDPLPGVLLGLGAGLGDAVKSFFKRRVGIPPGAPWIPFDQLDFLVGAYVCVAPLVVPPLVPTLLAAPLVGVGSVAVTAAGYGLGLKESWI